MDFIRLLFKRGVNLTISNSVLIVSGNDYSGHASVSNPDQTHSRSTRPKPAVAVKPFVRATKSLDLDSTDGSPERSSNKPLATRTTNTHGSVSCVRQQEQTHCALLPGISCRLNEDISSQHETCHLLKILQLTHSFGTQICAARSLNVFLCC